MFSCCTCCVASCFQVPLLKGLSDNDLLRVAGRMPERVYEDSEALIKYGERGDEMYLIRYGKVGIGSCSCALCTGMMCHPGPVELLIYRIHFAGMQR